MVWNSSTKRDNEKRKLVRFGKNVPDFDVLSMLSALFDVAVLKDKLHVKDLG